MKNIPGGINGRVDIGEEMIIEVEDIVIETVQTKHIKMTEKNPQSISEYLIFLTVQVCQRWDGSFQFLPASKWLYFDFMLKGYFYRI